MLGAARAAFRSCFLRTSRTIPSRIYHSTIPSYRPYIRKSALWYRRDGTPRSKLIGALNASFIIIYAFTSNAKSHNRATEIILIYLFLHGLDRRNYDFSTIKDSLDFFFTYIALDKGDIREHVLDMVETSQSSRDRLRKHLEEYCEMLRKWEGGAVKTGFALEDKRREMVSDIELRLLELPAIDVERPFCEPPAGMDRYKNSSDGRRYEEVG